MNLDTILALDYADERVTALCKALGITAPGAYAVLEPDNRLMIWAAEYQSQDDDGQRAVYRSAGPISEAVWSAVRRLAWIDGWQVI